MYLRTKLKVKAKEIYFSSVPTTNLGKITMLTDQSKHEQHILLPVLRNILETILIHIC